MTRGHVPDPTEPLEEAPVPDDDREHDHEARDAEDASTGDASTGDASTGDAAVDDALARLEDLDDLPVREHVAVFDAVHASLQDRLADVED